MTSFEYIKKNSGIWLKLTAPEFAPFRFSKKFRLGWIPFIFLNLVYTLPLLFAGPLKEWAETPLGYNWTNGQEMTNAGQYGFIIFFLVSLGIPAHAWAAKNVQRLVKEWYFEVWKPGENQMTREDAKRVELFMGERYVPEITEEHG